MSHHPTHSHPTHRRRKASGLFTNGVLAVILIVGCVYAVWGIRPLRQAWAALGFGRLANGQTATHIKTSGSGNDDPAAWGGDPNSNSTVPLPPLPLSALTTADSQDDGDADPFLSDRRSRKNPGIRRPSTLGKNTTEAELDRRFELEAPNVPDSETNTVRTADFEEPAGSDRLRSKRQPNKKIQYEVEVESTEPQQIKTESQEPEEVRQTAGENDVPGRPAQILNRGGVKAKPASSVPGGGPLKLAEVQQLVDAGRDVEAYQLLATAYTQYASDRPRFQELLDKVAQRIYFSPQPHVEPAYEIQPGDQLRKIATKYHLSWQYLSRVNQVDARKIRPGKKLKVFQGPFNATVDLDQFELVIYLSGNYVKRYSVGVGKDNSSPLGEFNVKEKLENPTYYGPEGNVLAADDPKNPLGERWIDIGNSFGIHGTIEPNSIGKSESAGCIRLRNEDVAEVYDLLTVGSTVTIQR
jgi:lipoprotein-anchoring transpeptidase ErfK/SrfK